MKNCFPGLGTNLRLDSPAHRNFMFIFITILQVQALRRRLDQAQAPERAPGLGHLLRQVLPGRGEVPGAGQAVEAGAEDQVIDTSILFFRRRKIFFSRFAFQIKVPQAARRCDVPHQAGGRAAVQGPHHHAVRSGPPRSGEARQFSCRHTFQNIYFFRICRVANGHGKEGFNNHPGTGN